MEFIIIWEKSKSRSFIFTLPCQKDKQAELGNLLTKLCSPPHTITCFSALSWHFSLLPTPLLYFYKICGHGTHRKQPLMMETERAFEKQDVNFILARPISWKALITPSMLFRPLWRCSRYPVRSSFYRHIHFSKLYVARNITLH
jgi:hypothetical protein